MAPLPEARLGTSLRCFAHCEVDFAGPFVVKLTRKATAKRYLCLFTCASTRAVHLEVAYALDTASFLDAFSRIVARSGKPEVMISDSGSNFTSAERELRQLVSRNEELLTAVVEVEGILNSRPLTYCSSDPDDELVLTQNHFLFGQMGGQLAPRVLDKIALNPRNRWRFV